MATDVAKYNEKATALAEQLRTTNERLTLVAQLRRSADPVFLEHERLSMDYWRILRELSDIVRSVMTPEETQTLQSLGKSREEARKAFTVPDSDVRFEELARQWYSDESVYHDRVTAILAKYIPAETHWSGFTAIMADVMSMDVGR